MRNKASEFIKYPLYLRPISLFEKILIKTTFGGLGKMYCFVDHFPGSI